jgi:acyl-coenzyme A synthetase/AMP-(fatty) acid ligase
MQALPLFAHARPDSTLAWRNGRAISARRFLFDVHELVRRLPAGRHVLNLCADRYRFTVGLAASLISGRCSLLPPTHTPEVVRQLRAFAPDAFCLTDDADCTLELPLLFYREADNEPAPAGGAWSVPRIDAGQLAAFIFTSGSTGVPVPHRKTFGRLVRCVQIETAQLAPIGRTACAILGTVPPQHMYGFESTVLLPLQSGSALCAERPFFPADIAAGLQRLPRPRVLVTTPVHLRSLLAAEVSLPALDLVVSATAEDAGRLAAPLDRRLYSTVGEY